MEMVLKYLRYISRLVAWYTQVTQEIGFSWQLKKCASMSLMYNSALQCLQFPFNSITPFIILKLVMKLETAVLQTGH
jgi:hypothetical protein